MGKKRLKVKVFLEAVPLPKDPKRINRKDNTSMLCA